MNKRWKEDQAEELATELHGNKNKQEQNINTEGRHIFQSRMRQRRLLFLNKH
jgi:hypothetical protein